MAGKYVMNFLKIRHIEPVTFLPANNAILFSQKSLKLHRIRHAILQNSTQLSFQSAHLFVVSK